MFQGIRSTGLGSLALTDFDEMSYELDLFSKPKLEVGVKHYIQSSILPLNMVNEGPIEFIFPAHSYFFYQPNSARLFAQYKLVEADGGDFESMASADANAASIMADGAPPVVAIANTFPTAVWSAIDVTIGDVPITNLSNQNHPYKAYLEYFCSYGGDAHNTHLANNLCDLDTAGAFDSLNPKENYGLIDRMNVCEDSRSFQSYLPLSSCDFMQTNRLLPPGFKFALRFTRSRDAFSIMSNNGNTEHYKVHFEKLKMFINLVDVNAEITKLIMSNWLKSPLVLPMNKTEVKHFIVTAGNTSRDIPQLFHGAIPKQIVVTFVKQTAFNGVYSLNPFKLEDFNLSTINLRVNGEQWPQTPYEVNCKKALTARLLGDSYSACGVRYDNCGNSMTPAMMSGGGFMAVFDLSSCNCAGFHMHKLGQGEVELNVSWREQLNENIVVLAYATWDCIVEVDKEMQKVDFKYLTL